MDGQVRDGTRRGGYTILARHRVAEKRVEAIGRRWEEFRDAPTPKRLAALRRAVEAADRQLALLAAALDARSEHPDAVAGHGTAAPSPRDLVDAGRELDAIIHGVHRAWTATRSDPRTGALRRIADGLLEAERAAATLSRAVGAMEPGTRAPSVPQAHPAGGTLNELLSELHAHWSALGRRPTLDGTMRLRAILAEARRQAAALAELASSGSPLASPEALTYLGGAAEQVHFRPYRDRDTGSYNGPGFEVSAAAELDRCSRYGRPFGLILLALAADEEPSARPVIGAIRSLLRGTDMVGRPSDGELALALPESDGRATRRIAARILRALDAAGHGGTVRRLAYAVSPEEGQSLDALMRAARARLVL